jgi:hypothetical protein
VIRLEEITHLEGLVTLGKPAYYDGNVHIDAIVALYKTANDYWNRIILGSNQTCGNPYTDVDGPLFTYKAPPARPMCTNDAKGLRAFEPDLKLVHKRFFGGIALSKPFYRWVR